MDQTTFAGAQSKRGFICLYQKKTGMCPKTVFWHVKVPQLRHSAKQLPRGVHPKASLGTQSLGCIFCMSFHILFHIHVRGLLCRHFWTDHVLDVLGLLHIHCQVSVGGGLLWGISWTDHVLDVLGLLHIHCQVSVGGGLLWGISCVLFCWTGHAGFLWGISCILLCRNHVLDVLDLLLVWVLTVNYLPLHTKSVVYTLQLHLGFGQGVLQDLNPTKSFCFFLFSQSNVDKRWLRQTLKLYLATKGHQQFNNIVSQQGGYAHVQIES